MLPYFYPGRRPSNNLSENQLVITATKYVITEGTHRKAWEINPQ
jgi:hypothetical protein